MKRTIGTALICLLGLMSALSAAGQTSGQGWTLRQCIDYARENNIQVQSSQVSLQSAQVDLQQAKADPDALARIHDLAERHSSEKGERKLQLRRHLFGQLRAQCRPDALQRRRAASTRCASEQIVNRSREYEVEVARNDIEIAVTQAYLGILYSANETVKTNAQTVESSAAQMERSKALLESRLDRPQ